MVETAELLAYLRELLDPDGIRDYTANGLQVEGGSSVQRLMTGVTACQPLLEAAADWEADALLVHHGWFWKNEPSQIVGMKRRRLATTLAAGFNLLAYHLPLDVHPGYGNNAELGRRLGVAVDGAVEVAGIPNLVWHGTLVEPLSASALGERLTAQLGRAPVHVAGGPEPVRTVAWCTGAGQDFIDRALELGVDAFVSGEIAERTTHTARECGIHYYSAGHHATERDGVRALGEHLAARFGVEHRFFDVDNPA